MGVAAWWIPWKMGLACALPTWRMGGNWSDGCESGIARGPSAGSGCGCASPRMGDPCESDALAVRVRVADFFSWPSASECGSV